MRRLVFALADYIYKHEHTSHAERFGYYYVLLLIISQLCQTALILGLSIILGIFKEALVIIIAFIVLRSRLDGFHATKLKACTIFSTIFILGNGIVSKLISRQTNIPFVITSIILAFILVLVLRNKQIIKILDKIERRMNKW